MKLRAAHIKNFRLLKDLKLDFSVDEDRHLTVIRAANETGKTTTETALIWGLYGSSSLPGNGKKYPLYPSDSISQGLDKVEISVEIEFDNTEVINAGKSTQTVENRRYKLLRTCVERPSVNLEKFQREHEKVHLFEVTPKGVSPIDANMVHSIVENCIPESLKDVYFTDGDSAMSFIEAAATTGVKRQRVRDAVESLLGLETLERTIKHLNLVAKKFSSEIDQTDYSSQLESLNDTIDGFDEDLVEWKEEHKQKEVELREGNKRLFNIEGEIESILKLGDRDKLLNDIKICETNIDRNKESAKRALNQISLLLRNKSISLSLVSEASSKGLSILNKLSEKKELPRVNIPILEELLSRKECFCGSGLNEDTEVDLNRRTHIKESIESSREADELSEAASSLFYSVRSETFGSEQRVIWLENYMSFSRDYADRNSDVNTFTKERSRLEEEVDKINNDKLEIFRTNRTDLKTKLTNMVMRVSSLATQIKETEDRRSDKCVERDRVEKKAHKTGASTSKLDASRLCIGVLDSVFARMRNDEVHSVSTEMNRIFLDMIGSRPDENDLTLITKAELTDEFDIKVYGQNGHLLDPDTDINGASRRAITLAFILALTKVSRVEAPNVIDTPLGMMSGYVKQSVLLRTLEEGSQIILFLTHDEIKGVESILDEKAGIVYTLTNPAHYPNMLTNKPDTTDARVIRCECNHRKSCSICERKEALAN